MAKIVKFNDGNFFAWSRVDLDNGEPLWIGVMGQNVIVKKSKSRWGLSGETLYSAKALIAITMSQNIHIAYYGMTDIKPFIYGNVIKKEEYDAMDNNISNPHLFNFTLAAMDSESASQLSMRLNSNYFKALADEKRSQFMEKLDKFGMRSSPPFDCELRNSTIEPVNQQANKSKESSKALFEQLKKIIPNKQAVDEYFNFNKRVWDSYVRQMAIPDGWNKRYEYNSVMAFNPKTNIGFSIQLLFKDNSSLPNILIIGNYCPLGTLTVFSDDIKINLEKEAVNELGPQYSLSAAFVETPPFEGVELTVIKI
jgi:hypothetical protein